MVAETSSAQHQLDEADPGRIRAGHDVEFQSLHPPNGQSIAPSVELMEDMAAFEADGIVV